MSQMIMVCNAWELCPVQCNSGTRLLASVVVRALLVAVAILTAQTARPNPEFKYCCITS